MSDAVDGLDRDVGTARQLGCKLPLDVPVEGTDGDGAADEGHQDVHDERGLARSRLGVHDDVSSTLADSLRHSELVVAGGVGKAKVGDVGRESSHMEPPGSSGLAAPP